MLPTILVSKRLWTYVATILVVIAILWKTYSLGRDHTQALWDVEKAVIAQEHAAEIARLEKINRTVEVRYMTRVQPVMVRGKERVKVVKEYITKEDDSRCAVGPGFVELHNSAAEDRLPNASTPGEFDAGVTPPQLSDVGQTVVTNYGKFHLMRTQCESLQEWARSLALKNEYSQTD